MDDKLPMRKRSTLIYFVNSLQADLTNCENNFLANFNRLNLTGTDPDGIYPSERVVEDILNFARIYEVLETKTAGHTELILN